MGWLFLQLLPLVSNKHMISQAYIHEVAVFDSLGNDRRESTETRSVTAAL